uniref:ATP synthase F0 subunit 8 n=1 Tax=Henschiella sp. PJ-2015 TaxID=1663422 RepID=A0A342D244_9HEMI|nr:ATP synthase F0 subunit 8 [Henschiella sp. PJ-2015]
MPQMSPLYWLIMMLMFMFMLMIMINMIYFNYMVKMNYIKKNYKNFNLIWKW